MGRYISVEFDQTDALQGGASGVIKLDPSDPTLSSLDKECNNIIKENDTITNNYTNIIEVNNELKDEIPVLEKKLENPSAITDKDAMLATESLKYKLKRLNIPLNNSKALSNVSIESINNNPSMLFNLALEDDKSLLQKTGDAISKMWEWIKKQIGKIWDFIKRLFGNVEAKAKKMLQELNGVRSVTVEVDGKTYSEVVNTCPAKYVYERRGKNSDNPYKCYFNFLVNAKDVFPKLFLKNRNDYKGHVLEIIKNSHNSYPAFKNYAKEGEYIIAVSDKKVFVLSGIESDDSNSLKSDTREVKHDEVVNDNDKFRLTAEEVIKELKQYTNDMDTFEKLYDNIKNTVYKHKAENLKGIPGSMIANTFVNYAMNKCTNFANKYLIGAIKCNLILGKYILDYVKDGKQNEHT